MTLRITEEQARELYRLLHHLENQSLFAETYQQLQSHFFAKLTITQLQTLLDGAP